jgi:hypothetical protein
MRFGTRSLYDKHTRQSAAKHQTQRPFFTPRIRSLIALRLTQPDKDPFLYDWSIFEVDSLPESILYGYDNYKAKPKKFKS